MISKLMTLMKNKEDAKTIMGDILEKFKKIPNTGLMQIWL